MKERYSKVEAYGITGEASAKTRVSELAKLQDLIDQNLHQGEVTLSGRELKDKLFEDLDQIDMQLAILVGYSPFHHELAKYFKKRSIPVKLYGLTPDEVWKGLDFSEVKSCLDTVFVFSRTEWAAIKA